MRTLVILGALAAAGCAPLAVDVDPMFVSEDIYLDMPCDRLMQELRFAHMRAENLSNFQNSAAQADARGIVTGAWLLGSRVPSNAGALAVAKGERDAMIRAAYAKDCPAT